MGTAVERFDRGPEVTRRSEASGTRSSAREQAGPTATRGPANLLFALSTSDTPLLLAWAPSCCSDVWAVLPVEGRILITSSPALQPPQRSGRAQSRRARKPLQLPFSGSRLGRRVKRSSGSGLLGVSIQDMRSSSSPPFSGPCGRLDLCMVAARAPGDVNSAGPCVHPAATCSLAIPRSHYPGHAPWTARPVRRHGQGPRPPPCPPHAMGRLSG